MSPLKMRFNGIKLHLNCICGCVWGIKIGAEHNTFIPQLSLKGSFLICTICIIISRNCDSFREGPKPGLILKNPLVLC